MRTRYSFYSNVALYNKFLLKMFSNFLQTLLSCRMHNISLSCEDNDTTRFYYYKSITKNKSFVNFFN